MHQLTGLDWIVFFIILALTLFAVFWGNAKKENNNSNEQNYLDLILMGRKLTLPLFVATLVATWYGGIFGVTKMAFEEGLYNFLTQGIFWYATYIIFALLLVKKIRSSNALTLPDMVGKEFGPKSQKIAALLNLFNVIPITYAMSVGLFLNILFGISLFYGTCLGVTLVLLYSTKGGLRAVVFSDLVQFFVMVLAVALVLLFSIFKYGGWSYLSLNLPHGHLQLHSNQSIWTTIMWGVIALSTLVDPNFYQRCLAAKNYQVAKKGIFFSTIIWIIFDICTTFGALYAKASMPELSSKTAYLDYALTVLPSGLRGLILAGVLATIISTLDSYIFIGATTIVNDLMGKRAKNPIKAHHFAAIAIGLASIVFSYLFKGDILKVWKLLGGMSASCLLIPIVLGRFYRKEIGDQEFFIISLTGMMSIIIWNLLGTILKLPFIDDLYIGVICTMSLFIFYLYKNRDSNKTLY